eukprot:13144-Rhodomonas_salina.1
MSEHSLTRARQQPGFNYLIMDTRGRGDSEGDFFPVQHEKEDGRAVVEWVKRQVRTRGEIKCKRPRSWYKLYEAWGLLDLISRRAVLREH